MITKNCAQCGQPFQYNPPANYADNRKYCDPCKLQKEADYQASQQLPATHPAAKLMAQPVPVNAPVQKIPATGNEVVPETGTFQSTVWNHQVRPHSSEIGAAGNRHKIYWETVEDLQAEIRKLVSAGLMEDPEKLPEY